MNKLTAIRSFGDASYSPARQVKLFNDRWYLVRMQNVERGQGDYVGLGEGEYVELIPGSVARQRRDAKLNHCNSIAEYDGPVFEGFATQYSQMRSIGYFISQKAAFEAITRKKEDHERWIADCAKEGERHREAAANIRAGKAVKGISSPELHDRGAEDCDRVIREHRDGFRCDIKGVRP